MHKVVALQELIPRLVTTPILLWKDRVALLPQYPNSEKDDRFDQSHAKSRARLIVLHRLSSLHNYVFFSLTDRIE